MEDLDELELNEILIWYSELGLKSALEKKENIKFVPVGKKEVIQKYGIEPYVQRVKYEIKENNVKHIFLTGLGPYASTAVQVSDKLAQDKDIEIKRKFVRLEDILPKAAYYIVPKH